MNAIRIARIDHCTLIITDMAKARAFYGELLGLKEIAPPKEFDFVALWFDLGGHYLHLLLKPQPDTPSPRHICFLVEDVRTLREMLKQRGLAVDETVKIAAADRFFIRDPFGNRIELLQWDRPYDPANDGRFSA
jgi:catechol 2,3-dioxygenase-like lactoylglutathione lyase family enzyme